MFFFFVKSGDSFSGALLVTGKFIGNDLVIAIKEEGKTYEELTNKVTIANWIDRENRIETFEFNDDGLWHVENDRDFNTKREVA